MNKRPYQKPDNAAIIKELARAKAAFQQRTIAAYIMTPVVKGEGE